MERREWEAKAIISYYIYRWRMWQSQLSVVGKVFPIILPDTLTDVSLNIPLTEMAEHMLVCSLQRIQEVDILHIKLSYSADPI